jgi:pantoate kinase
VRPVARRKTLLQRIAEESTKHVLLESTRAAIEKMAEDFAREAMADPEYRDLLRREARAAAKEIVAALREANPELHGGQK